MFSLNLYEWFYGDKWLRARLIVWIIILEISFFFNFSLIDSNIFRLKLCKNWNYIL